MSYAVVWSDGGAPARAGRLVVTESALELHGRGGDGEPAVVTIEGSTLATASAASRNGERLNGCPTIVLERRDSRKMRIGALEFAVVGELLDQVAALPDGAP